MTGKPLALTDRDRRLLQEVQRHGALTREQVLRLQLFGSKTRANDRLQRLTAHGYLRARPQPLIAGGPRFVYLPGAALIATDSGHRLRHCSDLFLEHHLGVVDVRLAFETHTVLRRWLSERDLLLLKLGLVPDAYLEFEQRGLSFSAFVEYDRGTEPLGRLEAKARAYVDLAFSGRFQRAFQRQFFKALFITDSDRRLQTMTTAVARVTDRVIRLTTRATLLDAGPLGIIWRKPGLHAPESLTPS